MFSSHVKVSCFPFSQTRSLLYCFCFLQVGDFGLSKVKHQTLVSGGVRGTLPWMAPELLSGNGNMVTEKVLVIFIHKFMQTSNT